MRALCGAIITAGALIGLGLTALGIGTRYTMEHGQVASVQPASDSGEQTKDSAKAPRLRPYLVHLSDMDRPLVFILIFMTSVAIVGLGITFLGLAYHHARREREFHWEKERAASQQRTTV